MPIPTSSPPTAGGDRGGWTGGRWSGGSRWTAGSSVRLSDADRAEVAGLLTQHFSEGRLDRAEFDERLERAMSAKTSADLEGVLNDLPPLHQDRTPAPVPAPGASVRRGPGSHRLLAILLVVVAAVTLGQVVSHLFFFPWLWIALAAFLLIRYGPRRRGRRC